MSNLASSYNRVSVKDELIDRILLTGTTIGFLVLVISLFPLEDQPLNLDLLLDTTAIGFLFLCYVFRSKLSIYFKSNTIFLLVYAIVISDTIEDGLYTPDTALIVILPFLSILVYNLRVTFAIFLFCMGFYFGIGYCLEAGILLSENYQPGTNSMFRWLENIISLSVVIFVITLFLQKYMSVNNELILNQEEKNKVLQERDTLLTAITRNIPRSYLTVIDESYKIQFTGGSSYDKRFQNTQSLIGAHIDDMYPEIDHKIKAEIKNAYQKTFSGSNQNFELEIDDQHYLIKSVPLQESTGETKSILSVIENITDLVETQELIEKNLEEKSVLLQEIHHRVKNNLAIVSGLLTLQNARIDNAEFKHIISKSVNRILSIAKVHELLYESQDFTEIPFNSYVEELSKTILSSMNSEDLDIEFKSDIQVDCITITQAVPLGIIFNELITNTIKYGFSEDRVNQITISVTKSDEFIRVNYHDNGIGIVHFDDTIKTGLGFTLIDSLLSQIDATHSFKTNEGFELSFSFPIQ